MGRILTCQQIRPSVIYWAKLVRLLIALLPLCLAAQTPSPTISAKPFPPPDFVLHDSPHKEPPSGVQFGPNGITIQQGVGTPAAINVLAFSGDGKDRKSTRLNS